MKTKIVLWGHNAADEKILIGLELLESENKVKIITFPEESATEEFYNQMMNLWREGQPVLFPDKFDVLERPLSMSESLLPDDLKTTRTDILSRAKTEWHFVVLSAKLYNSYAEEIQDFEQRLSELKDFSPAIWEEMKAFWSKVQSQVREKNLFKEHAGDLRNKTNALFDTLKKLKRSMDEEFEEHSREHLKSFMELLQNIEERIEKGLGLQPIFNELKNLQRKFREIPFTRKDRSEVWKRLDDAFKLVKEKKFGKKQGDSSALSRIERRYQGLLSAISKMEISIKKDKKEKAFQEKRIQDTDGQLELQIRQAKLAMIEERVSSKELKLQEMSKTRQELEKKISIEKAKEERRLENEKRQKIKEEVKEEIAKNIKEAKETMPVMSTEAGIPDTISEPQVTEEKTPEVSSEPPVTEEDTPEASSEPQVTEEKTPEVSSEPPVTEEDTPEASSEPQVTEEKTPEVSSEPPVTEEDTPEASSEPQVTEEKTPEVSSEPSVTEEGPTISDSQDTSLSEEE